MSPAEGEHAGHTYRSNVSTNPHCPPDPHTLTPACLSEVTTRFLQQLSVLRGGCVGEGLGGWG